MAVELAHVCVCVYSPSAGLDVQNGKVPVLWSTGKIPGWMSYLPPLGSHTELSEN